MKFSSLSSRNPIHLHEGATASPPLLAEVSPEKRSDNLSNKIQEVHSRDEETMQGNISRAEAQRYIQIQERERRQIAAELHDELGQLLTILQLQLESSLTKALSLEEAEVLRLQTREQISYLLDWVRSSTNSLYPAVLDRFGLVVALRQMMESFSFPTQRSMDLQISGLENVFISKEREWTIYRIVQEAVTNSVRHSQAKHISVEVKVIEERWIEIKIQDDGVGFDKEYTSSGNGLTNIQDRAFAIAGEAVITSLPGAGTVVHARLPLLAITFSAGDTKKHSTVYGKPSP